MKSSLSICDLKLAHGRHVIFNGTNLELSRGITVLLGPNGAGKTTLLEGLAHPERIRRGHVVLAGEAAGRSGKRAVKYQARVGYMPQAWTYFPGFTVRESVEYMCWLKRIPSKSLAEAANAAIERVDLLDKADRRIGSLSGGMRQRVGLAEAICNRPAVLYLDEPTVGLDPGQRSAFRSLLRNTAADSIVLLSTHLTDDVAALAERVVVVENGRLLFDGTPEKLAGLGAAAGEAPTRIEAGYLRVLERDGRAKR